MKISDLLTESIEIEIDRDDQIEILDMYEYLIDLSDDDLLDLMVDAGMVNNKAKWINAGCEQTHKNTILLANKHGLFIKLEFVWSDDNGNSDVDDIIYATHLNNKNIYHHNTKAIWHP